jgi:ribosomal protein L22
MKHVLSLADRRKVLLVTKANAKYHSGVEDPSNMYVLESYVGKGIYGQGLIYKSKGRMSIADKYARHHSTLITHDSR